MAASFLKKVAKEKAKELEKAKKKVPQGMLLEKMLSLPPVRNFRDALYLSDPIAVIGEIKKKMPGAPSWKPRLQPPKLAQVYEAAGCIAISVVTDEKNFGMSRADIDEIKSVCKRPVLCKDFIIDPYQIYEARAARADALLLIAELIPEKELPRFVEMTTGLGMTPVVEVHSLPYLKGAMRSGADVLLINNRDLGTLKVNLSTVDRLAKAVPKDTMVIAASGYKTAKDVAGIASDRVKALLIGKSLIEHKHPENFIRELRIAGERL